MEELSLKEFQEISLNILNEIHEFCLKNGIRYSLAYGTMLGAVRHHGFIPWDDDIDIIMPRPDYERFIHSFNNTRNGYKVISPELDPNFNLTFAAIYDSNTILFENHSRCYSEGVGVKIDLFPLDGTPKSEKQYFVHNKLCSFGCRILAIKNNKLSYYANYSFWKMLIVAIVKILTIPIPYAYIQKKHRARIVSYNYDDSVYVDNLAHNTYFGKRHKKIDFDSSILMDFGINRYFVASGYDRILTTIYGDYMKLPPEEKRITHHNFKAFRRS